MAHHESLIEPELIIGQGKNLNSGLISDSKTNRSNNNISKFDRFSTNIENNKGSMDIIKAIYGSDRTYSKSKKVKFSTNLKFFSLESRAFKLCKRYRKF
jgi:hypothetical protein